MGFFAVFTFLVYLHICTQRRGILFGTWRRTWSLSLSSQFAPCSMFPFVSQTTLSSGSIKCAIYPTTFESTFRFVFFGAPGRKVVACARYHEKRASTSWRVRILSVVCQLMYYAREICPSPLLLFVCACDSADAFTCIKPISYSSSQKKNLTNLLIHVFFSLFPFRL